MAASLFTCSGASVGVSISTQRRMPSRMVLQSNGLAVVSMCVAFITIVIPGCALLGAGPESICPMVVVDSGLALRAPRNDGLALVGSLARSDLFDQLHDTAP